MFKLVFFLHKHPDLSEEAFRKYWRNTHGPLVAKVPGLCRYVLGNQVPVALPFPPLCDGLAELWFKSVDSMQNALLSPEGQAATADAANCFDMARTSMMVVEETAML
ncbi:MAG: EthD family reductase [Geobacteraceae bacterium]|nr:EthD family reductase [Geobacteraceae bacterium]